MVAIKEIRIKYTGDYTGDYFYVNQAKKDEVLETLFQDMQDERWMDYVVDPDLEVVVVTTNGEEIKL